jgi:hypothetical protein
MQLWTATRARWLRIAPGETLRCDDAEYLFGFAWPPCWRRIQKRVIAATMVAKNRMSF